MKPEAQRIAIAEACGWKPSMGKWANFMWAPGHINSAEAKWEHENGIGLLLELPDYLNDLDAMHEAEKVLSTPEKWQDYSQTLALLAWRERQIKDSHIEMHCRSWIHATAAQRAEAFLKTIGKWEYPQ